MAESSNVTRREAIIRGGAVAAGMAFIPGDLAARLTKLAPQEAVVPWLNPPPSGGRSNFLDWQALDSWVTPTDKLFRVGHYGLPEFSDEGWTVSIEGLVDRPTALTLADIRSRPRQDRTFTLECAGNRGRPALSGMVHNARWTGTPLAPILREAGIQKEGIEVVFFGNDTGEEEIRDTKVTQNFARSMTVEDAMDPNILLAYEVNGGPLPTTNGFPLRLIVPGWYGVANVKWLNRIEVRNRRFMNRFMARDYVTLRPEEHNGRIEWVETSVNRGRVNSVPAKVTKDGRRYTIHGAAWGGAIARVEVRVDNGPWQAATLGQGQGDPYAWTFWTLDWGQAAAGQHAITSRAITASGEIQPAADDPMLTNKVTYWESNGQVTRQIQIT
jgi:DMSO/TMAO reductase YedYZ molybdopterin-dependent catalytic subunit